jgi:hypothetical protein
MEACAPGVRPAVDQLPIEPMSAEEDKRRLQRERRRLAEIFGEVLPDSTTDDQDDVPERPDGADGRGTETRDAELLRDVPPHHG